MIGSLDVGGLEVTLLDYPSADYPEAAGKARKGANDLIRLNARVESGTAKCVGHLSDFARRVSCNREFWLKALVDQRIDELARKGRTVGWLKQEKLEFGGQREVNIARK